MLTGGGQAHIFLFKHVEDSTVDAQVRITDLHNADRIDLSQIDADLNVKGDQAFHIVDQLSGHAGEWR